MGLRGYPTCSLSLEGSAPCRRQLFKTSGLSIKRLAKDSPIGHAAWEAHKQMHSCIDTAVVDQRTNQLVQELVHPQCTAKLAERREDHAALTSVNLGREANSNQLGSKYSYWIPVTLVGNQLFSFWVLKGGPPLVSYYAGKWIHWYSFGF